MHLRSSKKEVIWPGNVVVSRTDLPPTTSEGVHDGSFVDLATETMEEPDAERTQSINDPDEEDEIQQELLSDDETDSSVHHSGLPERKGQAKVIYLCGGCHQILAENIPGQKLIGCEGRCRKWFHMNCARLTDPDYIPAFVGY
jgi:hypothetical protein